ncbi:hypothetical protein [Microbacterium sp. KR10-403]|uniref:hypothetical protein n=1 Tax=Microbacterium sp. KR10-403 TaxID=3158581 RepID=UPI0032E37086
MGKNVKIKWNRKAFPQLRKERGVMSDLIRRGRAIQAQAGSEYEVSPFTGKNRARVSVAAVTDEAKQKNAKSNDLVRALDAGR